MKRLLILVVLIAIATVIGAVSMGVMYIGGMGMGTILADVFPVLFSVECPLDRELVTKCSVLGGATLGGFVLGILSSKDFQESLNNI